VRPFAIHADAEAELREAIAWYEERRTGLGREFRLEFEAALGRVRENPQMYADEGDGVHYCPLRRFPYTLVYLELGEEVWVVALAHQRRRPRYWAKRLPEA
jgi:toxin ParE1/3/4